MKDDILNICQVSLSRDIPIIKSNYNNFSKIYENLKFYIICQSKDVSLFKKKLPNTNIYILNEEEILSFDKFKKIFLELSKDINYKVEFEERLSWYYQQMLKISFVIDFVEKKKDKIVIWDADTVILRKIKFFNNGSSNSFGTLFEFHKAYYATVRKIFGTLPSYFISSLIQFIPISIEDVEILKERFRNYNNRNFTRISEWISNIIFNSIFQEHEIYNGSMFSEYETIGLSNIIGNKKIQSPIFALRFGLDGILTETQKIISKFLGVYHVTYEHAHPQENSKGMLERKQSWIGFLKIIIKDSIKFYLRYLKHLFLHLKTH